MENIKEKVYNFKTRHKEGFLENEINNILKEYPNININAFNNALYGITTLLINDESVTYHRDIYLALLSGIENRSPNNIEWD